MWQWPGSGYVSIVSDPNHLLILTHREAAALLRAIEAGEPTTSASLDLGLSTVDLEVSPSGAVIGGSAIGIPALKKIAKDDRKCFEIVDGEPVPISVFSETTNWVRTLCPTSGAPTTLVAGFPMHRVKGTDPIADTKQKIRALGRARGRVLDTATGLGYTAIELAKAAIQVVTVELDPAAIDIARRNPWSRGLFERPNIRIVTGDVFEAVDEFADSHFDAVLHDPPTLALAGELYSGEFYRKLHRVLRHGGKLFHYIGDPDSAVGASTTRGVMRRLGDAGFREIKRQPRAFGVSAIA